MQTHFAVIYFDGDLSDDGHPAPDLRGRGPSLTLVAVGTELMCWQALDAWTKAHPLREGETAEILQRDPDLVRARMLLAPRPDLPRGQEGPIADYGGEP